MREYGLDVLAVTEGENGASLYSARGECVTADGLKAAVVDTVGAGDAFAAVLAAVAAAGVGPNSGSPNRLLYTN